MRPRRASGLGRGGRGGAYLSLDEIVADGHLHPPLLGGVGQAAPVAPVELVVLEVERPEHYIPPGLAGEEL